MRILITGANGQVGWECRRSLQALGQLQCVGRDQCDLTRTESIRALIHDAMPDLIINAAAYTAVDRAEAEVDLAHAINAVAPAVIADTAKQIGTALIHLSTDYVFDGTKAAAYREDDACNPLSVYGRTKLEGELAIVSSGAPAVVLRTSWVYAMRGHNFVRTMLRLARERDELRVVDDQWGAPTWARSIAEAIAAIAARAGRNRRSMARSFEGLGGVYHLTASGSTTWYRFARQLFKQVDDPARILKSVAPIASSDYPTLARRPSNSVLDCSLLQRHWDVALPSWDTALQWALADVSPIL